MTTRERPPQPRTTPSPPDQEPRRDERPRETGDAFLAAADRALERAMSGSPEDFLRQNRQLGGQ